MYFLVSAGDIALLIDPYQGILDFLAALGRFVDTDVDSKSEGSGLMLQAEYEGIG
jgi:hypothetical protein